MTRLFGFLLALLSAFSARSQPHRNPDEGFWYKDALIYSVDVKVFKDADGDGIGDFKGLTSKLGYIQSLGINTIWLAPFQPSPLADDGYDITDYMAVDPRVGTKVDFLRFVDSCHRRRLRVIMDLVLDHTSDQHPWFRQSARSEHGYRNWYFWQTNRPPAADSGAAFPGVQKETWTFFPPAKSYYYHRFYNFQPHLNFYLPAVRQTASAIMRYWLGLGVDGFRVDAVPFMIEKPVPVRDTADQLLSYIPTMREVVNRAKTGALLLGEANVPPKDVDHFSGQHGEGLQMLFNFYVNQYLFYGLASSDISLLRQALRDTKSLVPSFQWVYFLRNHDEVDLGRLDSLRQQQAFNAFGPDPGMQLYHRGVRRRLAPMLSNSLKKIEMAYAVAASLPGAFMIRYGEEIGMGDDLNLKERLSVRTPMQWDSSAQGGFTSSAQPFRPLIRDSVYGLANLNVARESSDSTSLLPFVRRLLRVRAAHPEIANGAWRIADSSLLSVLAIQYTGKQQKGLLVVANFSEESQTLTLDSATLHAAALRGLFNVEDFETVEKGHFRIGLPPLSFEWYETFPNEKNH